MSALEDDRKKTTSIKTLFRSSSDRIYPGEVRGKSIETQSYSIEEPGDTVQGVYLYAGNPHKFMVGEELSLCCDACSEDGDSIAFGTLVVVVEITSLPSVDLATVETIGGTTPGKIAQVKLPLLVRGKVA